jgi:hypothetical protein
MIFLAIAAASAFGPPPSPPSPPAPHPPPSLAEMVTGRYIDAADYVRDPAQSTGPTTLIYKHYPGRTLHIP